MSSSAATAAPIPDRERLILDNQGLIWAVAFRLRHRLSGTMAVEDLVSAGQLGLISAADSFDVSRGCRFSTHATFRIYGAIMGYLDRSGFPRRRVVRYARARDPEFRPPTVLTLTPETDDGRMVVEPYVLPESHERDPLEALGDSEFVRLAVRRLPRTMKRVILLKYVEGLNFPQIGRILGMSASGAQLSHKTALARLREQTPVKQYLELGGL